MARKIQRKSSDKKAAAEKILRELQDAKKSDDAPAGLDDLIKSIQNEAKREEKRKKEVSAIVKTIGKSNKQESKPSKEDDIDPRILELLGIEDYEAELDYEDYVVLLKEVMAKRSLSGSEEKEGDTDLLRKELKRARNSSGKFKPKKKTVKASNFVGDRERSSQTAQQTSNKITTLGRDRDQVRTEIKKERQEELIPLATSLNGIEENLKQILELDKEKNKREKKAANKLRREKATARRRAREERMEGGGSKADPKSIEKKTKPFQSAFDAIMNFVKNVALGGLVNFLFELVQDPGMIVRPFYDFANFIVDFINDNIIGFINDVVLAPVNLLVSGLNGAMSILQSAVTQLNQLPFVDLPPIQYTPIDPIAIPNIPTIQYPQWAQKQEGGGEVVDANSISMVDGGAIDNSTGLKVKGMGKDTQLIAAQPGEIMMSKKAVDAYGAANLLNANALAGGNNTPNFGKILGYAGGGMVGGGSLLDFIGSGEGGYNSMNQGTIGDRIVGSTHDSMGKIGKKLTDMTIGEIMERQAYLMNKNNPQEGDYGIFAAGKYQIVPYNMPDALRYSGLSKSDMFSQQNQDQLGIGLIMKKKKRVGAYLRGESNDLRGAVHGLSEEFASIPNPDTGMSNYGSGNRALHTVAEVEQALQSARTQIMAGKPITSTGQLASSNVTPSNIQPYESNNGGGTTVLPVPQQQQVPQSTASAGQKEVPGFSAEDANNFDLIVVKSIYNIVG